MAARVFTLQDYDEAILYLAECVVVHGERFAPFLDKLIAARDQLANRQDPVARAKAILEEARRRKAQWNFGASNKASPGPGTGRRKPPASASSLMMRLRDTDAIAAMVITDHLERVMAGRRWRELAGANAGSEAAEERAEIGYAMACWDEDHETAALESPRRRRRRRARCRWPPLPRLSPGGNLVPALPSHGAHFGA